MMAADEEYVMQPPLVWQPADAAEACRLKLKYGGEAVFAAGTTLLRTQWESGQAKAPKHLIDLGAVNGIRGISIHSDSIVIGACTTLSAVRRNPILAETFPLLQDAACVIAAPSIRNLATIGGNIVSAIGDSLPALLVYGAELIWHDGCRLITEPLAEWLNQRSTTGSGRMGSLLLQVKLPYIREIAFPSVMETESSGVLPNYFYAYEKVGRRESFTPSLVTTALTGAMDGSCRLSDVRIAAGGGQMVPVRLHAAETLLEGRSVDEELLGGLYEQILIEYQPIGDAFASAAYRKQTAANLIAARIWRSWNSNGDTRYM
ncbi:FAD binding domain-containing protein [Paenibacillus sepulcri]